MMGMFKAMVLATRGDSTWGHMSGWGGDHMSGWGGGWMWLWGSLMMLTLVAFIAAAIWLLARSLGAGLHGNHGKAREILDERYARGELTVEEYRERREHIT